MANSALSLTLACALLGASSVAADNSDQSVALAARAFGFVRERNADNVRIALVRDPSNPQSAEEAQLIRETIGKGLSVGKMRLTLTDVSLDKADEISNVDVIWLTGGLSESQYRYIAQVAEREHSLSVSSNLDCVNDGWCVLGIQSKPSVKIVLNSAEALKAGLAFEPAFRMMVTEQ